MILVGSAFFGNALLLPNFASWLVRSPQSALQKRSDLTRAKIQNELGIAMRSTLVNNIGPGEVWKTDDQSAPGVPFSAIRFDYLISASRVDGRVLATAASLDRDEILGNIQGR